MSKRKLNLYKKDNTDKINKKIIIKKKIIFVKKTIPMGTKTEEQVNNNTDKKIKISLESKNNDNLVNNSSAKRKLSFEKAPDSNSTDNAKKCKITSSEISSELSVVTPEKKAPEIQQFNQIPKPLFVDYINQLFKLNIAKQKVLTDIIMHEGTEVENSCTIVGRAKVPGSSYKQMRHVIPVSFLNHLISESVRSADNVWELAQEISKYLILLLPKEVDGGLVVEENILDDKKYKNISSKIKEQSSRVITNESGEKKYLVSPEKAKNLNLSLITKNNLAKNYKEQNTIFLKAGIEKLLNTVSSKDQNTMNLIVEHLTRYMLVSFNQRATSAYPEEGNTVHHEIRYYKNKSDAKSANKSYEVMTALEINDMIIDDVNLSDKIRIVNCEGANIVRVKKALVDLNSIIRLTGGILKGIFSKTIQKIVDEYNSEYNKQIKLTNEYGKNALKFLKNYNQDLDNNKEYQEQIAYHTVKQLFIVFDYKSLEKKVFIPSTKKESIDVYSSATGVRKSTYIIKKGEKYRKEEVNKAVGYNDKVIFRNEEKFSIEGLAKKIFDHVTISILAFSNLSTKKIYKSILNKFEQLIAKEYQLGEKDSKLLNIDVNKLKDEHLSYMQNNEVNSVAIEFCKPELSKKFQSILTTPNHSNIECLGNSIFENIDDPLLETT